MLGPAEIQVLLQRVGREASPMGSLLKRRDEVATALEQAKFVPATS
jgi:hypothetical protein